MKRHTIIDSPVGPLALVLDGEALCGLYMDAQARRPPESALGERADEDARFAPVIEQLGEYFAGQRTEFTVPLAPQGDRFQQRVWQALTTIPYGTTRSYGEIAAQLGDRNLARAVGSANARNPIGIIVPCHRVIGANGKLVGYAGGIERKQMLLSLEQPGRVFQSTLL